MNNNIKKEIDNIEIPSDLHERSKTGVQKAKLELPNNKRYWSKFMAVAASLLMVVGSYGVYKNIIHNDQNQAKTNNNTAIVSKEGGLKIPSLILPDTSENASMDMIGLIVYNGKVYTQTATEMDTKSAESMLGEKLGKTKGTIDEWSKQDEYAIEFASTIGVEDVYSVKGYDKDFRIMTFSVYEGEIHSEYYESFNGMTIYSGEDIFGKLKISGNVVSAQYQTYSDWDKSVERFYPMEDKHLLNSFVAELNHTIPYSYDSVEKMLGDFRNDEEYRHMIIQLNDGSKITLVVLKDGYVRYGNTDVYFKMEGSVFEEVWRALSTDDMN
jgi:hypothetical protein